MSGRASLRHSFELGLFVAGRSVIRALPHWAARRLGAGLGTAAWALDRRHRRVVAENLARAFPDAGARPRRRLARATFRHLGAVVVDALSTQRFGAVEMCERLTLEGWEHLVAAQEEGRGAILLSAHLGSWEIAGHAVALFRGPLHTVARPFANTLVYERYSRERSRFGQIPIAKRGAARPLLRILRGGGTVGLLIDQRVRPSQGIQVPFFGHPALTTPLPASLSVRTGAPAVPVFAYLEPAGRYRVEVLPPILPEPEGPEVVETLTRRYLAVIEERIRARPAEWLWMHRRWRLD